MYDEDSVRGYWLGKAYRPLTATEDGGRGAPGHFALVGPTDEWIGAEE